MRVPSGSGVELRTSTMTIGSSQFQRDRARVARGDPIVLGDEDGVALAEEPLAPNRSIRTRRTSAFVSASIASTVIRPGSRMTQASTTTPCHAWMTRPSP